jgi:hypothetical protein
LNQVKQKNGWQKNEDFDTPHESPTKFRTHEAHEAKNAHETSWATFPSQFDLNP